MSKGYLIFVLCFVIPQWVISQPIPASKARSWLKQLAVAGPDSGRVQCLLDLAAYYQLKPGEYKPDIDSACLLTRQADTLARRIGYRPGVEMAALRVCLIKAEINDTLALEHLFPNLSDSNKVKLLLEWGVQYIFITPIVHKSAINRMCQASVKISAMDGNARVKFLSDELSTLSYLVFDNPEKAKYYARRCVRYLDSAGDRAWANQFFYRVDLLVRMYRHAADSLLAIVGEAALKMDLRDRDYQQAAAMCGGLRNEADGRRDYAQAIRFDLQRLSLLILCADSLRMDVYINLIQDYSHNGDFYHALLYGHEALLLLTPGKSPDESCYYVYYQLSQLYLQMGRLDLSIEYAEKGIGDVERSLVLPGRTQFMIENACSYEVVIARNEALALCRQGHPEQGLHLMETLERRTLYPRINMSALLLTKAECYSCLKEYDQAGRYFDASLAKASGPTRTDSLRAMLPLAQFFMDKGQPKKAGEELQQLLRAQSFIVSPYRLRDIYYLLYRSDSAGGNLLSALTHLKAYNFLNDSLFSMTKNSQFEAQQLKFTTEAKDREMQAQAEHIQLLQKEEELQRTQLRSAHLLRNMTMAGALLSFLLLILLYNRYRLKRRSTRLLEAEQRTVREKNTLLQQAVEEKEDLLAEKDDLLAEKEDLLAEKDDLLVEKDDLLVEKDDLLVEKEWLLKEVHHRVKNNLQIVISLLSMASGSIDNEAAERYILESRNRIYAMSLIHQKLYKAGGMVSVEMDEYVRDLVSYLDGNYNAGRRIRFHLELERITVDESIAVPIGLILNEAITNAIKHAFPGVRHGAVHVVISQPQPSNIRLTISDDGVGLPPDFKENKKRSMGMNLMKALVRQVHGSFELVGREGVRIQVEFPFDQSAA